MIQYLKGDATQPVGDGKKFIVHVCNDRGGWGSGFVVAVSKRWPEPEANYRRWHAGRDLRKPEKPFALGEVQFVQVAKDLAVVNMVAQVGYGPRNQDLHRSSAANATPPIRYEALEQCLTQVGTMARFFGISVHMPRIGCDRGGGKWEEVEPIIERTLHDVPVFVYDLPG